MDPVRAGLLETTLGNTGGATDSLLPLGADNALGAVGKALIRRSPVVDTTVGLTQQIGATTGLGAPVDGVLTQVGGTVSGLGDTVAGTGLPGGLSTGLGGLVDGLGKTVASTGGLLHADANNPEPLTAVLGNATGAVGALTGALGGQGGLLNPVNQLVGGIAGGVLDGPTQPILQPALTNTGTAADNVASLGLGEALDGIGARRPRSGHQPGRGRRHQSHANGGRHHQPGRAGGRPADQRGRHARRRGRPAARRPASGRPGRRARRPGRRGSQRRRPAARHAGQHQPLGNTLAHATSAVSSLTGGLGLGGITGGGANGGLLAPSPACWPA